MPRIAEEMFQATHGLPPILFGTTKIVQFGSTELKGRINKMGPETVEAPRAAPAKQAVHQPKQLPPPNSDFYELYETLNADELATVKRVRAFMEAKVAPVITKYWVEDAFPFELLPAVKEVGIGGLAMEGYGCVGGGLGVLGCGQ